MTRQDKKFQRGDKQTLIYKAKGDHSSRKIIFAMKEKINPVTTNRILEKKNTLAGGSESQITASYDPVSGLTTINVLLNKENTQSLTSLFYFADITSESLADAADHITIVPTHTLKNLFDVQTDLDGLPEKNTISFEKVDLTGVADNCFLIVENGKLVNKTLQEVKTILGII